MFEFSRNGSIPEERSFETLLERLRAALPHMRTQRSRTLFDHVLRVLSVERQAGRVENAPIAAPRAMDMYRSAVRGMTADDRGDVLLPGMVADVPCVAAAVWLES